MWNLEGSISVILNITACVLAHVGDEWHLRKTNWCGEAADILDNEVHGYTLAIVIQVCLSIHSLSVEHLGAGETQVWRFTAH